MLEKYVTEPKILKLSDGWYVGTQLVQKINGELNRQVFEILSCRFLIRSDAYDFLSASGIVCDVCTNAHAFDDNLFLYKYMCYECSIKKYEESLF